jgi:2-polyprenyl-3-methyl-5-hydroxy-6-metoxy-1,4-benzoquinol methylase
VVSRGSRGALTQAPHAASVRLVMAACSHPTTRTVTLFPACDYVSGETFEILRCETCGLARTVPPPASERMAAYYPQAYYGAASARRFPALVERLQRSLYGARARAVERLAGGAGYVLDVGCGRGFLLEAFRRRGWSVQGTELDARSAAHAREVLGLPVETAPAESWPWPDGTFDAISLWHVLEHLSDPAATLERVRRLLRPGGVLMVGVPNFGSTEARLAGPAWFHLDVPRHVVHLTPAWLEGALHEAGLEVRRRSFFAPEFDAFSFVQSAENRLGLRHNLLYDLLRGPGAKLLRDGAGRARARAAAAALLMAAPLGVLAIPATLALSLAGRGSSLTLYAVRRS